MVNLGREGGRRDLVRRWSRVRRSLEDPKDSSARMALLVLVVVGVCTAGAGYWWWSQHKKDESGTGGQGDGVAGSGGRAGRGEGAEDGVGNRHKEKRAGGASENRGGDEVSR